MGKIRAEGMGEVQEMIDICDFAVGLSRQLYGLTMHSERPGHRMYEQWHPLGPVGVISAFNFPVAVWAGTRLAAVCGDTIVWKPSSKTPLTAPSPCRRSPTRCLPERLPKASSSLVIGSGRTVGRACCSTTRAAADQLHRQCSDGPHVGARVVGSASGRSILELGGNNAIIVAEDADLDMAVRASSSAPSAPPASAAHRRAASSSTKHLADLTQRLVNAYKQVHRRSAGPRHLMGPLSMVARSTT
jgi:aldehyde dehydrogenase (NAD+)